MGTIGALTAQENCPSDEDNCGHPSGFYVGAEYGAASTDFDNDLVESLRAEVDLNVTSTRIEDSDNSFGFLLGYQFNKYLAIETGYRDLGEYWVDLTGVTTDVERFFRLGNHIYPESGQGISAGVVLSYPITDAFKVAGKFGMWTWDGDIKYRSDTLAGESSIDDVSPYYGLEASYQVSPNWQTYVSAMQYKLIRDTSTSFSLGVRYFFGDGYFLGNDSRSDSAPASRIGSPSELGRTREVESETLPPPIATDTDGDGVYDAEDQCANTPSQHLVDAQGCSVYEEVVYSHQLTIYYNNNSTRIDAAYASKIQELADFANQHQIKYMLLVGHTSAVGKDDYNQWLSEQRVKAIQRVLIKHYGYTAEQIETLGKGETELLDTANSETAHQKNRRVEVNLSTTSKQPKLR